MTRRKERRGGRSYEREVATRDKEQRGGRKEERGATRGMERRGEEAKRRKERQSERSGEPTFNSLTDSLMYLIEK